MCGWLLLLAAAVLVNALAALVRFGVPLVLQELDEAAFRRQYREIREPREWVRDLSPPCGLVQYLQDQREARRR